MTNKEYCVHCNKNTDSVLISRKPDDPLDYKTNQCLVCKAVSGSISLPPGSKVGFEGDWKEIK